MDTKYIISLITSLLAFIAAIIAAIVTIYNARFQRFTKQRVWDKKAEAYSNIIESLSSLVYYYETLYDAEFQGRRLSEDRISEIDAYWKKAHSDIKKATSVGSFLIS